MAGTNKRKHDDEGCNSEVEVVDKSDMDILTKIAAAKVSPSVVGIVSRNLPDEMADDDYSLSPGEEFIYRGSGIIIECEEEAVTHNNYVSTIITAACFFERTNGVPFHRIKVDVYLSDNELYDGKVVACDFHYNLAALQIRTDSPLQTATLTGLNDVFPLRPTEEKRSFQLRPHSNLFKIYPGTKVFYLSRDFRPSAYLVITPAVVRATSCNTRYDCNEIYWLNDVKDGEECGGPVVNHSGEVIGVIMYDSPFIPTNVVSRWWKHFKTYGQYCRPFLGVEVANLYSSSVCFLEVFDRKFPNVNTGVIVEKVAESSPAYCSGIRPGDVLVECNGRLVRSKLELFDIIWDKVGASVEVTLLRPNDGGKFKLSLTVGETTPENFYKWPQPPWTIFTACDRE